MRGLLLKDVLVLRKTLRFYVIFIGFYFAMALMGMFDISFVLSFLQIMLMMLPISAFSYDDLSKWNRYAFSLPLGRRKVVVARYLFALLLAGASAVIGLILAILSNLITASPLVETLGVLLATSGIGLCFVALMFPLCYKLGAERARPYLFAGFLIPFVGVFALSKLGFLDNLDLSFLDALSPSVLLACFASIPLIALVGVFISFLISVRIVEKMEF